MKHIIGILFIALLLNACNKAEKQNDGYMITGTAKGVYNGMRVYLKASDERGTQTPQDTAIVMNETFSFDGKVDYPQMWFLSVDNVSGIVPIMVENEEISVNFDKNEIQNSTVAGTKSNKALIDYNKGFKELLDKRNALNQQYATIANTADSIAIEKLTAEFTATNEELRAFPIQFLKTQNDNFMALSLIENLLRSKPDDLTEIDAAYNNLTTDIKNSVYGTMVGTKLNDLKKQNESLAMLNVGKVAPDFSAPDPNGKQISLNEIKGKATIIDFWAAWCGPCRKENPNVVRIYNKYHDKGLEIIGVSLDRQGQKDKWLKAIEDDKLTWHHVSNLDYFNDPVARQYNIQAIPATFILDADGKIVAKNLRGQALEDKIAEMLN